MHWSLVDNIKRDPFEMAIGQRRKDHAGYWAARLPRPVTAYIYDWNMLPIGQLLWLKELEKYTEVSADAGSGELQPDSGHGAGQER